MLGGSPKTEKTSQATTTFTSTPSVPNYSSATSPCLLVGADYLLFLDGSTDYLEELLRVSSDEPVSVSALCMMTSIIGAQHQHSAANPAS